jgi:hypothetical protein
LVLAACATLYYLGITRYIGPGLLLPYFFTRVEKDWSSPPVPLYTTWILLVTLDRGSPTFGPIVAIEAVAYEQKEPSGAAVVDIS